MDVNRSWAAHTYQPRHASASTTRAMRSASRPRYGPSSAPVQVQPVAAAFAVVVDILGFHRGPGRKFEIVRDNARAFFELLFENRRDFVVRHRQQIDSQQIGGGIILL